MTLSEQDIYKIEKLWNPVSLSHLIVFCEALRDEEIKFASVLQKEVCGLMAAISVFLNIIVHHTDWQNASDSLMNA